jgi:cobalt-zinc-cadmium efflux system outer membrane protein
VLADAEIERARAAAALTSRDAKGTPTLTIGPRRERAAFSSYSDTSVGVSLSMPFGGAAHRRVAVSAAARVVAEAEAARLELLRQLDFELHEARHDLLVIESSLELARRRSDLAAEGFAMSQQAFTQGEMTLLELLRRAETDQRVRREVAGLEVERQRAIARINHGVGIWP